VVGEGAAVARREARAVGLAGSISMYRRVESRLLRHTVGGEPVCAMPITANDFESGLSASRRRRGSAPW